MGPNVGKLLSRMATAAGLAVALGALVHAGRSLYEHDEAWAVRDMPSGGTYGGTSPPGPAPILEIDLTPDFLHIVGKKERIEYHAGITSHAATNGAVAWTVFIANDLGDLVTTLEKGDALLKSKETAGTHQFQPDLPDGFYSITIRAFLHTPDGDYATESRQYLGVSDQKTRELSEDEWFSQSRASIALHLNSGDQLP